MLMTLYDKVLDALNHHAIDELGILPCPPDKDTLPLDAHCYFPLIVVDGKLGIAFDDVALILQDTQKRFVQYRQQQRDKVDPTFEQLTRIIVLLKPEHYTALNARKQLVLAGHLSLQEELKLLELIFTVPRNTKCSIAWHHRQWLLDQNMALANLDLELRLCQRSITLYPRNYYAWNHRHWLLTLVMRDNNRLDQEYQVTCRWIENNISDHSGLRYLEEVLKIHTVTSHVPWLEALLERYPGHESLWCHRRYCATLFGTNSNDHRFIQRILASTPSETQRLLAAKFGLWLCHLDDKWEDTSLVDTYLDHVQQLETTPIYLHHWKRHLGPQKRQKDD